MRWLRLLVILSLAELSVAQTTTYTGVIKDLSNAVVTSGQVQFTLTPPSDSAILGTARFVPTTVTCLINGSGQITGNPSGSCIIASNTALVPTGTAYRICIQPQFITPGSCFFDYAVTSSKDISTVLPTLGTGLVNYRGPAGPTGPTGSAGPTGPAGPIASVFGRTTSAITAANGDYTCSQVTNAVCTPLNLYYQTVQVAASSAAARPRLNFISGANITIGCVDNSGNNSTDCTVATTGTPRTCNAFGCYRTFPDGTIEQWGVSTAFPTGATTASVPIIFPIAFTSTANLSVQAWPDNCADSGAGCSSKQPVTITGQADLNTTGFTVWATGVIPVGGGGSSLLSGIHAMWRAIGN